MPDFCTYDKNISGLKDEALLEVRIQIYGDLDETDGKLFVTPFMFDPNDVDQQINCLIKQLKRVGEEAKARLSENGFKSSN